jgi:hypothetical protein
VVLFNVFHLFRYKTDCSKDDERPPPAGEHCVIITSLSGLFSVTVRLPADSLLIWTVESYLTMRHHHQSMSYENSARTSRRKILASSFRFLSFPISFFLFIIFSFFHGSFTGKLKKKSRRPIWRIRFIVQSESTGSGKRYLSVTEYCLSNRQRRRGNSKQTT